MKKCLLASVIIGALSGFSAQAQTIPENDKTALKLFFSASKPVEDINYIPPLPELSLMRGKVVASKSCKGNIGLSISNAFTDGTIKKIFENFDSIMEDLAGPDGAIFLASLYVSKTNPNVYQLVTEGIDMTLTDFLSAMGSCEAMAQSLVDIAADPIVEMQQQTKLNNLIEANAKTAIDKDWNNLKVEDMVRGGTDYLAEYGVKIFNGVRKGGKNQQSLDMISDTIHYGWCIYRGYTEKQCENEFKDNNKNKDLIGLTDYEKLIFRSEKDFHRLGMLIIGNKYLSMCNGCESINVSGQGVLVYLEQEQKKLFELINNLSKIKIRDITETQFNTVSIPPSIVADANYFRNLALLDNDMEVRNMYALGWAYDVSYQRAIILLDMLENSLKGLANSPTIENAGLQKEIERALSQVETERGFLTRHIERNNYRPKMYIRALLSVADRLSKGKSPLGEFGDGL
ncbi:hypothetical protein DDN60_12560 [Vibrio cholerae]|nr:hypothetical protein [Vibrio cholerae]